MFNKITIIAIFCLLLFQSCSSTKVLNSWKADSGRVDEFKKKKVLVIARTANDYARMKFEREIADQLRAKGIKATESYTKAPKIYPNKEMSEERMAFIRSLLDSEGYDGIVITVIKDKQQTTSTSTNGVYFGASYSNFYPAYYGGFYNYYSHPYAYGSYYDSFGGYIPTSTSTRTTTKYVLETIAYNLDASGDDQIVAVVTTNLDNPKDAAKTAKKYVDEIMKSFQ
jgi:ribosomal protein S11